MAFVTAGGKSEPVRLTLANDGPEGEAFRLTLDGKEYVVENFPHIPGAPIRVALARTGESDWYLRLERGGEIFGTPVTFSGDVAGIRFWKNPYGEATASYDLWFDRLRVGPTVGGTEGEALETATLRPAAFYETGTGLSGWSRATSGNAIARTSSHLLCNIGSPAFELRADDGASASLQRRFGFALTNGYELSFDFQNNAIEGADAAAGAVFLTADGDSFEFAAEAGSADYLLRVAGEEDVDTGVPVVRTGVSVAVAPHEGGGVVVSVGGRSFGLDVASDIDGIRFFDRGCGLDTACAVFFNRVAVRCEPGAALPEPAPKPDFFETGSNRANWLFAKEKGNGWAGGSSEDSSILGAATFYLYAGGNDPWDNSSWATAWRMFPDGIELGAGAVLTFRFAHGAVGDESAPGIGGVGWELLDGDTNAVAVFYAIRDSAKYIWNGSPLDIDRTPDAAHEVEFRFTSDTSCDFYLDGTRVAEGVALGVPVRGIRFWNAKAGSGAERNLLFNDIAVYLPIGGKQAAARRAMPREVGGTLLSKSRVWTLVPSNDIAVVARFVPAAADSIESWAAARGIDDPWTDNPETGRSYAEEYLLETNAVESLHGIEGGDYELRFTPGEHGVGADIEVSESLMGGSWRSPKAGELEALDASGRRFGLGATNTPTRLFLRVALRPAE